jgi:RimJ/RimL family protein N-acetyltransferase
MERGAVALRPVEPEDIDMLFRWHHDLAIDAWSGWTPRYSRARFEERYGELIRTPPEDYVWFGVTWQGALVGYVELAEISRVHRRGAVGFVVAERSARRQGVGTAAVTLLADYAFHLEDLDRLYAEVYAFNAPSLRLLERVGFQREGVLRRHDVHQGRREDVVVLGLLRPAFESSYPSIFPQPGGRSQP